MAVRVNYVLKQVSRINEDITLNDIENCAIESNNDSGRKNFLSVKTVDAKNFVTTIIATNNGYKMNYVWFEYDVNKLEKTIVKFLEAGTTQCKEITREHFKKEVDYIMDMYVD